MAFSYRNLGRNGRLGNQLFQIAGTIGKAHSEGDISQAFFPPWQYAPFFSVPESHFLDRIPLDAYDSGKEYLQNLSLFSACEDYIRGALDSSDLARELMASTFPQLSASRGHTTAVHVRRGDYVGIGYWLPICPVHYYTQAMAEVSATTPDTHFYVFSDDPEWCTLQFQNICNVTVVSAVGENSIKREIAEFTLMRHCDAFIISNSTFSWWAAYLSNSKLVLTPDRWYNEGLSHLDHTVFTPTHWHQRSIDPIGPYQPNYISVTESANGLIVTDQRNKSVHLLNPSASLLFELCTGSNTTDQIRGMLKSVVAAIGASAETIDVEKALDDLRQRGLVVDATAQVA